MNQNEYTSGVSAKALSLAMILITLIIIVPCALFLVHNEQSDRNEANTAVSNWQNLEETSYVTTTKGKDIYNKLRAADATNDYFDKIDEKTVVDNSDGHEYLTNVNSHSYSIVPKMNGKNAAINKRWLMMHKKDQQCH